ncbi:MAG: M28 family peptidase [Bacteroidota bacterium]
MRIQYILLLILLASCSNHQHAELVLEDFNENETHFQKMIIGQLSGAKSINTSNNEKIYLKSRWSKKEREISISYFQTLIEKMGLDPVVHQYKLPNLNFGIDLLIEPLSGKNIFTILESSSKSDEYVILGAHYDTGARNVPGAIDNGSGIALISEVLRKAIKITNRKKNLIVVFFDQEEEDISAGSTAFAKYLIKQKYKVHSVHTYDLIGWDSDNNKEVEIELPSPKLEELYKRHADTLGIPIYVTKVNSSDHYSFIKKGFEAVGISQAYVKKDNSGKKDTPEDKYEIVNFEYLASSTALAYEVIKEILND